ncbi:hypothetical protein D3C80_1708600 [compost metagenome]
MISRFLRRFPVVPALDKTRLIEVTKTGVLSGNVSSSASFAKASMAITAVAASRIGIFPEAVSRPVIP